jgi:uncharacterized protein (DUF2164 family)
MSTRAINDLIKTAQNAVETEIDIRVIYEWKKQALEYLEDQLGPDHYYTQYFTNYMKEIEQQTLLTGGGVLAAVREEVFRRKGGQTNRPTGDSNSHKHQERFASM